MTQKDKLMRAIMLAQRVKSLASQLESECKSYDETWAIPIANDMKRVADEYLNLK